MSAYHLFSNFIKCAFLMQFVIVCNLNAFAQNISYTRILIKPSLTDKRITNSDEPHLVLYDSTAKQGKLMVFLTGTGGIAARGPRDYFNTVVEQGYRLISLSYIDEPAVAQICAGRNLAADPDCANEFRRRRIYGKGMFSLIHDQPEDAIVTRLTKLLQYLAVTDSGGNWGQYLENGSLKWSEMAFSGQSQGGGMAEYIGKHQMVYKVISFSGGWDWESNGRMAGWYATSNVTPPGSWFATYNANEPFADEINERSKALGIPANHIYALRLPTKNGGMAHTDGIANAAYKLTWITMLGRGN